MGKKRFISYFGIPIPPFKEDKLGAGSFTIRFVLTGRVISKKNNNQAIALRKVAHDWANNQEKQRAPTWSDVHKAVNMVKGKMIGNAQYKEFLAKNKPIIIEQMKEWSSRLFDKGVIFPLPKTTMSLRLYIKDKYRRDTLNAGQTITDLLVDAGVIFDDDDLHLNPIHAAAARYHDELLHNIAFVSLSFKLPKTKDVV